MSSYGKNFSTRLFVQAAFTGFLAPMGAHGSTWLLVTFVLAGAGALIGALVRNGHEKTRDWVIGFEAGAVAVGAVGLMSHHYIPGTIVGIAALVTALNHPMPRAVDVPAQATAVGPAPAAPRFAAPAAEVVSAAPSYAPAPEFSPVPEYAATPAPQFAAPVSEFAAPQPVTQPVTEPMTEPVAEPVAPPAPPVTAPVTGVRAMDILPGR